VASGATATVYLFQSLVGAMRTSVTVLLRHATTGFQSLVGAMRTEIDLEPYQKLGPPCA